ncbi:conserved hypothetical protein [Vibrio nigripulchritudo SO65]|uniref:hypothetical protein n=1 Tax=Vibrio nigripulchritudo TaxID=28173 RepID=UPI0003B1A694|nr:hypothetical protein [Vibrio nigripulchritudo]CCN35785.1 conserved hypothetical protein [Vibrio nigripulchritudo AM115]CCN41177.1 conserved hypothetical protein [Vibrio nigripulchritudo FTn2]CCN68215.1 conserved hypothetical protein [Vibrio nigripulchritudo POn4]CCN75204.1 conserved hypothetical protein [Vibrio nigripulchritudo SO65]
MNYLCTATVLLLSSISFNAIAANYTCSGKVTGVSIDAKSGDVLVERIGPLIWPRLCKVDNEVHGISADACKTVYSTLLTAQTTNKEVVMWFNDGKSCETTAKPWQWITGWYFGPKLVN